jgi:hypothetical protein
MPRSPPHSTLHRGQAHVKPPCDRADRHTPPYQGDHHATFPYPGAFLSMSRPQSASVFHHYTDTDNHAADCSSSRWLGKEVISLSPPLYP